MADFVTDDGVRIVYDDLGPAGGTPVVICHGLAAAGEQMSADMAYFAGPKVPLTTPPGRKSCEGAAKRRTAALRPSTANA